MTENKARELAVALAKHHVGKTDHAEVKRIYDACMQDKMERLVREKQKDVRLRVNEIFNTSRNAKLVRELNETKKAAEDYETVKKFCDDMDNSNKEEKENKNDDK